MLWMGTEGEEENMLEAAEEDGEVVENEAEGEVVVKGG